MRILWIGDPHATPDDLDDARALVVHILDVIKKSRPDLVVFAGDLYHTHGVIHAEVQLFWRNAFDAIAEAGVGDIVVIKGNHDAPGDHTSRATALLAHTDQIVGVLYEPFVVGKLVFVPYTDDHDQFAAWSAAHADCGTLFCHQTFAGSKYENGLFAEDGISVDKVVQAQVVSGHIHTPQRVGRVWYPGAPRWRTLADANVDRAIYVLDFDGAGTLVQTEPYNTGDVCRRIFAGTDDINDPEDPSTLPYKPGDVYHVEIRGPQAYIEERRPLWDAFGARVRGVRTDGSAKIKVRESDGVAIAFKKWLMAYSPKHGTDKDVLKKLVEERLHGSF